MTTAQASAAGVERLIPADLDYAAVSDRIVQVPLRTGFQRNWLIAFVLASGLFLVGTVSVIWLFLAGIGIWGVNVPVSWGFAIINFVWWIGIGHAGTLISAILLLFRQRWRNSINRFAEAMTLFAVANAALFPLLHLGRPWRFYYIIPYPNTMELWPQWRSPLVWDLFAVATYSLVSLLFWYLGLIPDLATMRDTARGHSVRLVCGALSLGWRGSVRHWQHYQKLYVLLAGLATPLVVSVHSIVSLDFAVSVVPGWHSTIFPPYFVAGAIYSGFAMVLTIAIPLRTFFGFHDLITIKHLDNMAKVMLASGLIVAYGYLMEHFVAWYSGEVAERYMVWNRVAGPYAPFFWLMLICNVGVVQALWLRPFRTRPTLLLVVAILINVGMWLERFVIVVVSLHRDYLPSSWHMYIPTIWDWSLFAGTIGLFVMLMLLFVRFLPMISIFEMKELVHERHNSPAPDPGGEYQQPACADPAMALKSASDDVSNVELFGLAAEFVDSTALNAAVRQAGQAGYRRIDAYSPLPLPELYDALGLRPSPIPKWVLAGAVLGAITGYAMQWYSVVWDYPLNIGSRPLHSWPAFIPLTFELAVLGGALAGVLGLLVLNRLPRPYHPVLNVVGFSRASRDRFFLVIEQTDARFSWKETGEFLRSLSPMRVDPVPR